MVWCKVNTFYVLSLFSLESLEFVLGGKTAWWLFNSASLLSLSLNPMDSMILKCTIILPRLRTAIILGIGCLLLTADTDVIPANNAAVPCYLLINLQVGERLIKIPDPSIAPVSSFLSPPKA